MAAPTYQFANDASTELVAPINSVVARQPDACRWVSEFNTFTIPV